MDYKEYFKQWESDPDYINAERELKLISEIADEIIRLRLEKGWSQSELAKRAATKQANISRLESGLSNPSVKFLQKLADALETEVVFRFEKVETPVIDFKTNTENEGIHVPNWPTGKVYTSFRTSTPMSRS